MAIQGGIEQSEHWEERHEFPLMVNQGYYDCYPCKEGVPVYPWHNRKSAEALFEVVTAWGLRTEAWIDDTRQYCAEGLEWTIVEDDRRRNVPWIQIACWRRIPDRSVPSPP